jgi:predicted enzyme related to lactoylglutathione lyase
MKSHSESRDSASVSRASRTRSSTSSASPARLTSWRASPVRSAALSTLTSGDECLDDVMVFPMGHRLSLVEFPADDPERALRFWSGLLDTALEPRSEDQGEGWQASGADPVIGVHRRGRGPGDSFSLPYFGVRDLDSALERVRALGGSVVHPGSQWAICKDSEGSPFGLALEDPGAETGNA